jgi:hypothetical protein
MIYISIILFIILLYFCFNFNKLEYFNESIPKNFVLDINNDDIKQKMYLYNINTYGETLYYYNEKEKIHCSDSKCNTEEECKEDLDESICHKKLNGEIYQFISDYQSYIEIPNIDNNNIIVSFDVLLNKPNDQCILRSKNNLWELLYKKKQFIINTYENKILKEHNIIGSDIKLDTLYKFKFNINNILLNYSLNNNTFKEIKIGKNRCDIDNDCNNGRCSSTKCIYYTDTLVFGKNMDDIYFDGYIANIKLGNNNIADCSFDSKNYKNKYSCISDCKEQNCIDCAHKCKDVELCNFNPIGTSTYNNCVLECHVNCNKITDFKTKNDFCKLKCDGCKSFPCNDDLTTNNTNLPDSTKLFVNYISPNGKKIIIKWTPIKNIDISGYLFFKYKTFNKSESITVKKIINLYCTNMCEYLIEDLDPNETYTIFLKGYNKYGIGMPSNNITFKSGTKKINQDFNTGETPTNIEIGNYEFDKCK